MMGPAFDSLSHDNRWASWPPARFLVGVLLMALGLVSPLRGATVDRYLEYTPYKVQLVLVFDTSTAVADRLAQSMPREIDAQARLAYGPLWRLSITIAKGDEAVRWGRGATAADDEQLAPIRSEFDKLMVLVVRETSRGYEIEGTEYDCLLEMWGATRREQTPEVTTLEDVAFATMHEIFSPVAQFRPHPENREKVELRFRGAELPRRQGAQGLAEPGLVMRPYLREVDREGVPTEGGINPVNWTYLSVDTPSKEGMTATVYSHTRSPFTAQRRGRVEQLAIAAKPYGATTQLRLHSSGGPENPLAGFEVYQQATTAGEEAKPILVGKTDRDGRIAIPPAETPIQFALVPSGNRVIAKIPVVAGYDKLIEAPIVDDARRLEAAERLAAIEEELIDVVAQRKLIEARVKVMIEEKRFDQASKLVDDLDRLPNITYFQQQRLAKEALLVKSPDPRIQARIDRMFEATQSVLGEFLAPGLVQQLRSEIASAQEKTAQK